MKMLFGKPGAIAAIAGEGGISGCVKFYSVPQGSLVVAELCGLPTGEPGFFALHIHEGGDCGGEDFADTKGHFNPCGKILNTFHAVFVMLCHHDVKNIDFNILIFPAFSGSRLRSGVHQVHNAECHPVIPFPFRISGYIHP